jgi:3-oxoacyl-[acyl-carrier-protein] synthase-3
MLNSLCDQSGIASADVDWVLVHQANLRIIEALQRRTGIPVERWIVNLRDIGNTGSPSVLLALGDLLCSGALRPGHSILIGAFGAGLTWAGALLERHAGPDAGDTNRI